MRHIYKFTTLAASAAMILSLVGCGTVVTDVSAMVRADRQEELQGTLVDVSNTTNVVSSANNAVEEKDDTTELTELAKEDTKEEETSKEEVKEDTSKANEEDKETDKEEEADKDKETEKDEDSNKDEDSDNDENKDLEEADDNKQEELEDNQEDTNSQETEQTGDATEGNVDNEEPTQPATEIPGDFDANFYAQAYPDVVAVFGDSPDILYKHYIDYGQAEGRSKNEAEFALVHENPQN